MLNPEVGDGHRNRVHTAAGKHVHGQMELQADRHMLSAKGKKNNPKKKGKKKAVKRLMKRLLQPRKLNHSSCSSAFSFLLLYLSLTEGDRSLHPLLPFRGDSPLLGAKNGPIKNESVEHSLILIHCVNISIYTERRRGIHL